MAPHLESPKAQYESMCALGTAAHSPAAWRTMSAILTEAALVAPPGFARSLYDRADDCISRAAHVTAIRSYAGGVGAGFRAPDPGERTWLTILRDSGAL